MEQLDYISYSEYINEMIDLIHEANTSFYKDIMEYYIKLLFIPNTSKAKKELLRILKQYYILSKDEINLLLLIKDKYGLSPNHLVYIDQIIEEIDRHYEFVYQYYERILDTYEDLIDTRDINRFRLPKDSIDLNYYKQLQMKITHQ